MLVLRTNARSVHPFVTAARLQVYALGDSFLYIGLELSKVGIVKCATVKIADSLLCEKYILAPVSVCRLVFWGETTRLLRYNKIRPDSPRDKIGSSFTGLFGSVLQSNLSVVFFANGAPA